MNKAIFYSAFSLAAFAFNSILTRMALRGGEADAAGFTLIRLASGAATLIAISYFASRKKNFLERGNWVSAFFLFGYAIFFSLAYLGLTAGVGALILFGSVQLTMILWALATGERPRILEWVGLAAAVCGLVYLVWPGLASPPIANAGLMAGAGACWGFYTLRGRGSSAPLPDTSGNFIRSVPMMVLAAIPFAADVHLSHKGILLAVLSGSIASGVGYTVWYAALRYHTATRAAVLQLAVPLLAAIGGIVFLAERATFDIVIAAALILGGILMVIFGRRR